MMILVVVTWDMKRLYTNHGNELTGYTCLEMWSSSYYRQCNKCNASKPPALQHAPMTSVLIGKPWQIVAADILEVPVSSNNNHYLLVVQDYFTKWVEVVPNTAYA